MNNRTRHQKRNQRRPRLVYGHGSSSVEDDPGKDFQLDEKTGLFIPETAAKERRKVQIGFVKESE